MDHHLLESAEFYHRRYHNAASRVIIPSCVLLLFLILFALFAKKELTISTRATVEPVQILSHIQSTSNNPIIKNHLFENQEISTGDVLVEYQSENEQVQEEKIKENITALKEQISQLNVLKTSLELGSNQFTQEDRYGYSQMFTDYCNQLTTLASTVNQQNATIASQNQAAKQSQLELEKVINQYEKSLADYKELKQAIQYDGEIDEENVGYSIFAQYRLTQLEDKVASQEPFLVQIDSQINQIESQLASYNIQHASTGVQQSYVTNLESQSATLTAQYLTKVGQELTLLSSQLRELEATFAVQKLAMNKTKIVANQAGVIHLNREIEGAMMIPEGTVIAQVYPVLTDVNKIKITAYISSKDIARISEKDEIHFSIQGKDDKQVNLLSQLSDIATTATQTETGNFFKIEAETSISKEMVEQLRYGMEGKMVVVTGQKTYFQYLVDEFLGSE